MPDAPPELTLIDEFVQAACDGRLNDLKRLLPSVDVNAAASDRFGRCTALIHAVANQRSDCVEWLLSEAQADPNCRLAYGTNALMHAVDYGDPTCVALLAPVTDLLARSEPGNDPDRSDKTALRRAARSIKRESTDKGRNRRTQVVAIIASHMSAEARDAQFREAVSDNSLVEAEALGVHARDAAIAETCSALLAKNPKSKAPQRMPKAFARFEQNALASDAGLQPGSQSTERSPARAARL
ncbi:ankyrin repeat protein [Paraburkholderia fungorum]|jgi:hypothetical protein|uniref:ankyrin repeat domain-containing protein n=1 Tax=Paraburkholderia fungorum TaxID=134537 RepID=UPI000D44FD56|nr:ankyrin repeat domain-containing protein [Paraburkholderia fungorum]PRZ56366.1 ankyrin repeat protein [Paraburkholderia fungorum]